MYKVFDKTDELNYYKKEETIFLSKRINLFSYLKHQLMLQNLKHSMHFLFRAWRKFMILLYRMILTTCQHVSGYFKPDIISNLIKLKISSYNVKELIKIKDFLLFETFINLTKKKF